MPRRPVGRQCPCSQNDEEIVPGVHDAGCARPFHPSDEDLSLRDPVGGGAAVDQDWTLAGRSDFELADQARALDIMRRALVR